MAQRLSSVPGVGHVAVEGGIRPAVRIQADLARLASYGLSMADLRTAIVGRQRRRPQGLARRRAPVLHHRRQRPDHRRRRLRVGHRRLPQQRAGAAQGRGRRSSTAWRTPRSAAGTRAQPAVIIDVQRQPGANVIETVAARQGRAAAPAARHAERRRRSTVVHDRTGTIRASVRDVQFTLVLSVGAGGAGGAAVPAHHPRHHHRRRGAAGVAGRDLRRHVVLRLQPRQPVADGADHRHRLRRRRRDRHDREHRAPHGEGRAARCRRRSRARARSASRSSR